MKWTFAWCALLPIGIAGGCDLPELAEAQGGGDAGVMGGAADASPPAPVPDGAPPVAPPDAAPLGPCDPAGWAASASMAHPNDPPSFAIDGVPATRFSTGAVQMPGQWLTLDFGEDVTVDAVTLEHRYEDDGLTDYPRGMDVLASTDGATFGETLASMTQMTDPEGAVTVSFAAKKTRWLRLQLTAGTDVPWWSIHELTVSCASD